MLEAKHAEVHAFHEADVPCPPHRGASASMREIDQPVGPRVSTTASD